MMKRIPYLIPTLQLVALVLGLCVSITPLMAEVSAQLSQTATNPDEPVVLQLQIRGDNDAAPDLTPLQKDFEILGRSQHQSVSIINGNVSKSRGLNLTLLPKRYGTLTIPPIPVGNEHTAPLQLTVAEGAKPAEPAIDEAGQSFIQLELSKQQAYLQEEVILTVRLYLADGVRGESLTTPEASMEDTVLQLLHEEQYQAEHEGRNYQVVERRYAIHAYQTGRLELGGVQFRGRSGVGSRQSLFNLLRDPFGTPRAGNRIVRLSSDQVSLEILPVPADFTGQRWLPARNLQIVESGLRGNGPMVAGRPAIRHIMLFADGLTAAQLPAIELTLPEGIKQYPERPQLKDNPDRGGISGSRQSSVTLVATEAGSYTLPAIEIHWWNTEANQQEVARLPEVTLEVMPSPAGSTQPGSQPAFSVPAPISQAAPEAAVIEPPSQDQESSSASWLIWLLGLGWLATLLGWWLSHRQKQPPIPAPVTPKPQEKPKDRLEELIEVLEEAYQNKQPEAAKAAWLRWGEYRWPDNPPSNLNRLAERCPKQIAVAVNSLDRAIYSPRVDVDWNRFDLRELLKPQKGVRPEPPEKGKLIPLNPAVMQK